MDLGFQIEGTGTPNTYLDVQAKGSGHQINNLHIKIKTKLQLGQRFGDHTRDLGVQILAFEVLSVAPISGISASLSVRYGY